MFSGRDIRSVVRKTRPAWEPDDGLQGDGGMLEVPISPIRLPTMRKQPHNFNSGFKLLCPKCAVLLINGLYLKIRILHLII